MTKKPPSPSSPASPDVPAADAPRKRGRRPKSEEVDCKPRNFLFPEGAFGHTLLGIMRRAATPMDTTELALALAEYHEITLDKEGQDHAQRKVNEGLNRMQKFIPPVVRRTTNSRQGRARFEIAPQPPLPPLVHPATAWRRATPAATQAPEIASTGAAPPTPVAQSTPPQLRPRVGR